jgi:hypothetical protein
VSIRKTKMKTCLIFLVLSLNLRAAITTGFTVNWDVRTTGSDTNGGAFDSGVGSPGTDESQANSGTSVTVTIGGTTTQGTSSPAFTATTHGPGNFLNITSGSGCTTGRFEMLSQSAGTATFDRSLGTAASVCTGTLGGSLQTIPTAAGAYTTGNIINVKAGTYTITSRVNVNTGIWIGYNATHQDGGTKPLITISTNGQEMFSGFGVLQFINFSFSSTAGTPQSCIDGNSGNSLVLTNVVMDGFSNGINGGPGIALTNVEIKNSTSHAIITSSNTFSMNASWIHNNTGNGFNCGTGNMMLNINNSIISNNSNGIAGCGNVAILMSNSVIANNTTDGINLSSSGAATIAAAAFTNNIFWGNGQYAINYSGGAQLGYQITPGQTNAYGGQGTANFNNASGSPGDLTLTSNPFTSSTNFALNSTAGGGPIVKGTGFPGVFPGGLTTGTINVGAVQSSGGGGGSTQAAYPR